MNVAQLFFIYFGILLASIPFLVDKLEAKSEQFGYWFFAYAIATIAPIIIYGLCL
jgi:uncharacterized membrane protein